MDIQQIAIKYLSYRERSSYEVSQFLKGKGFSHEEIASTLMGLEELGYVNDDRYCEAYIRYSITKGKASLRIRQELKEKGIRGDKVDLFLEEMLDNQTEKENALREAEKLLRKNGWLEPSGGTSEEDESYGGGLDEKLKGKIGRRLSTMGYSSGVIYSVLEKLK